MNLLEPIMTAVGPGPTVYAPARRSSSMRHGNRSTNNAPRNTYQTSDGALGRHLHQRPAHRRAGADAWSATPRSSTEPWFAAGHGRAQHADLLDAYVGGWIAERTRDEVLAAFTEAGAAIAPIYNARDIVEDPHVQATEMIDRGRTTRTSGRIMMHNVMWRMSRDPGTHPLHRPRRWAPTPTTVLIDELGCDPRPSPSCASARSSLSTADAIADTTRTVTIDHRPRPRCSTPSSAPACRVIDLGRPPDGRDAAVAQPPGVLAHPAPPARRHGPRRRRLRRQRHDHRSAPTSAPTSTRWPTSPRTASCTAASDADEAGRGGKFVELGVHTIAPMVRRGVLLDVPAALGVAGLRARLRDHRRPTSRPPSPARAPRSAPGDVVLIRSGWGQHFDDGRRPYIGGSHRRARGQRGRRARGWPAAASTPPARTPSPSSGCARRAGTRCCRPTGCCWSSTASTSSRRWPGGARRRRRCTSSPSCSSPLNIFGATGSPVRPLAVVGDDDRADPRRQQLGRRSPPAAPPTTLPADGRRQRRASGCWTSLGLVRGRAPAGDQRAPPLEHAVDQGGRPAGPHRRCAPSAVPASAGRLRQRRARALARLRRHPPAVGAAPERQRGARPRSPPPSAPAPTASRLVARHRGRPGGLRPARHGRLRPRAPATRSSSSTASTPPRSAARWAARSPRRCSRRWTRTGMLARARASPPRMASGHHRGQPHRRHRQAAALRLGRPRRRSTAAAAGPAGLHRPADGAGGPVRLLPGVAARQVRRRRRSPTGSGSDWAVPGIFFKPYPANHFTHAADRRGARAAGAGRHPGDGRAHRRSACRPRRSAPSASRSRSSGPRRPATRRSSAARTRSAAGLLGGGGLGVGLDDFTDELARDPRRRALMAKVDVVRRRRAATQIFPHQFPAVLQVRTTDGREMVEEVLTNRGGPQRPLSRRRSWRRSSATTSRAGCSDGRRRRRSTSRTSPLGELAAPSTPVARGAAGHLLHPPADPDARSGGP